MRSGAVVGDKQRIIPSEGKTELTVLSVIRLRPKQKSIRRKIRIKPHFSFADLLHQKVYLIFHVEIKSLH